MTVVERLGRRKEEARAGLEAARDLRPPLPELSKAAARVIEKVLGATPPAPPPAPDDFALRLGAIASGLARAGADKITLLPSPRLKTLGPYVQSVVDRAVVVVNEPVGKKDQYAKDRLFVSVALASETHDVSFLAESGHPVLQWKLEPDEIAGELARWETAAWVMRQLLPEQDLPASEPLPAEPALRAKGLALFASSDHAQVLRKVAGTLGAQNAVSPVAWIAAHIALAEEGDHLSFFAPEDAAGELSTAQGLLRNATRLACTASFEKVIPHPRAWHIALAETAVSHRMLRVHAEDGDAAKVIESVREAAKLLSHK